MLLWRAIVMIVLSVSFAGVATAREADSSRSVSVFATVGHSEWCPSGTVQLSLETGRYVVRAPRTWRTCTRPAFRSRIRAAVLHAEDLAAVRAAYHSAVSEGLEAPACRNGGRPETIFLSNGGMPTLRLIDRARTTSAPADRSCWSDAASRLHRLLQNLFEPRADRDR